MAYMQSERAPGNPGWRVSSRADLALDRMAEAGDDPGASGRGARDGPALPGGTEPNRCCQQDRTDCRDTGWALQLVVG